MQLLVDSHCHGTWQTQITMSVTWRRIKQFSTVLFTHYWRFQATKTDKSQRRSSPTYSLQRFFYLHSHPSNPSIHLMMDERHTETENTELVEKHLTKVSLDPRRLGVLPLHRGLLLESNHSLTVSQGKRPSQLPYWRRPQSISDRSPVEKPLTTSLSSPQLKVLR